MLVATTAEPASPAGIRTQRILLKGYHGQPTPGTVTIRHFNRDERVRRALAGLGKWWGVAVVSVLIPVAHFVLVPSFLAYGVWHCFQRLGTVELVIEARGTCPDCGAEQALDLAPRWRAPQPVTCRQCHRGLQLVLPSS
ncbi:MAG TPA: hypothetical protein VIV88_00050 [Gemmatimonadales bacterium]|jgi:hypothetical protein